MYRTDVNHLPIKRALERIGRPVKDVARYHGFGCDLVTETLGGEVVFLEIKKPGPPHCRKLTESEQALQKLFPWSYFVVQTEEEALRACGLKV